MIGEKMKKRETAASVKNLVGFIQGQITPVVSVSARSSDLKPPVSAVGAFTSIAD
jgi:hypothetical protein